MERGTRHRGFGFVLAIVALLGLSAVLAFGQTIDGNVVGAVTDATGAAVVGAEVAATNIATNVTTSGKTGGMGDYRFDHLAVGTYRITVKMAGFKTTSEQVDVQLNLTATRNVTLQPGALTETVEVSGTPPAIDTTTSQLQTTYENQLLQNVPIVTVGTGVLNASLLQAGVGSTGGLGAGSGPSVGGQRPRENNFTIEGTDNNDKSVTGPLVYVPNDAVANFTVMQNDFSPEFGHSAGGQFNQVVGSGTNSIHGRVYEYFQNRNLNALDQALANAGITKVPRYDNNRFGGQVGGPILKNKLFYFVNFEYNPIGRATSPSSPAIAPTTAGWSKLNSIAGVFSTNASGFAKYATAASACTSAQIAQQVCPTGGKDQLGNPIAAGNVAVYDYTTATPTQYQIPVGVIPIAAPNYQNIRALITSMDYDMSSKDQIRGRYIYNRTVWIDNNAELPIFYTALMQPYHLVTLGEYHTFSANLGNEFRVGFNRTANNYTVPSFKFGNLDAFPNLTVDELNGLNVGPDPNAPQYMAENTYQLEDNLTWIAGRHSLKFGLDLRKQIDPQTFIQRSRGDYAWSTLDKFVHDTLPTGIDERSFGSVGYSGDDKMYGWYVNDIFKLRSNLSLNLGVRYEYLTVPFGWTQQALNNVSSVPGLITFTAPQAPKHDFMPRIGFAYSPGTSGNTSIRGGFSMGYDVLYDNIGTLARPPQIGFTVDCPGNPACPAVTATNGFLAQGGIKPQQSSGISTYPRDEAMGLTSSYLPVHVKYPYAESWNFGIQHIFASKYTAEVRYVGSRGVDLPVQTRLNTTPIVNASNALPEFIQAPSPAQVAGLKNVWAVNANTCPIADCPAGVGDYPGTLAYEYYDLGNYLNNAYGNAGFSGSLLTAYMPWGASTYHGLQTQVQRRLNNGLQFMGAWTWSHTIDNSTADFYSTDITPRRAQDFQNMAAERGNSLLNHAHRITIMASYDVPWFANDSNWLKKNLLGNYQFVPVFTWESGQWGTVQSAIDTNLNVDAAGDRAIYNPAGRKGIGSDVVAVTSNTVTTVCAYPPCTVGWQAANPDAQYIVAGYGTIANSSRGNLETPPINNFDMTAAKHFNISERFKVDFMAQAFNLFNHPQFVTGYLNDVAELGATGAVRNMFIPSQSSFDVPRDNFSSSPRTMQLALKFSF